MSKNVAYPRLLVALFALSIATTACSESSNECMRRIGKQLNVDRLLYGEMRAGAKNELTLVLFNVRNGRPVRSQSKVAVPATGLAAFASQQFDSLAGISRDGILIVKAKRSSMIVFRNLYVIWRHGRCATLWSL